MLLESIAIFFACGRHHFPPPVGASGSHIADGTPLAFPDRPGRIIAWITPNDATGQVRVSINGVPGTIFAQRSSGAHRAP